MSHLLSLLYFVYFFSTAVFLLFSSILLLPWTLLFDRNRHLVHYIASAWGYHFVQLNPLWKCRFYGKENVLPQQPYVIVANHQSIADTFILSGLHLPFKWVAKDSLFRIPFFGWNMFFTQYIPVERHGLSSIKKMMAACRNWLLRGESVLLFPEGTRSENGSMSSFKDGSFKLAANANVPVLPVVIEGTREILPKHGKKITFKADISVKLLPPVFPADFDYSPARLRDHVHSLMSTTLNQIRAGTAAQ